MLSYGELAGGPACLSLLRLGRQNCCAPQHKHRLGTGPPDLCWLDGVLLLLPTRAHIFFYRLFPPSVVQVVQMKKYQKEQEDIKHIKEFIASCGEFR